jgi:hypothetical protein
VDPLTYWSLGVATFAAVVGVVSLTWNIVAFIHSGARIKVEGNADMVLVDPGAHESTPVVTVTVRNVGRMPCEVTSWSLLIPSGTALAFLRMSPAYGPPTPHTLEPGHAQSWRAPLSSVIEAIGIEQGESAQLTPVAWLGTGLRRTGDPIQVGLGKGR